VFDLPGEEVREAPTWHARRCLGDIGMSAAGGSWHAQRERRFWPMVVETFRNQDAKAIYRRLREKGRMMPVGLKFVSSWVAADLGRCFQLMEADDITLLQRWIAAWSDLMAFEIVPVVSGKDTAEALSGHL
jgi:hypothetical protein